MNTAIPPTPNALYEFCGIRGPADEHGNQPWKYPPGVYRFLFAARYYRTGQWLYAYVGVGGPDNGNYHLCPIADWAMQFKPVK